MFQPTYTPPLSQKMAANYLKMLNREQMEKLAKLNPKLADFLSKQHSQN